MRNSARPGADLRIILQHCLQTQTRQIAHYNVNGLGQGFRMSELKSKKKVSNLKTLDTLVHFRSLEMNAGLINVSYILNLGSFG